MSEKICTRCVMDSTDPEIIFDEDGVCNHCRNYDAIIAAQPFRQPDAEQLLVNKIAEIKAYGRGRDYDCVIGLSGGVDSSYVAYLAKQFDLRPLAVHFDNGWNSEIAVTNIQRALDYLGVDLMTYVVDWEEFRSLQRAFFKASVIDIEMLTDHAQRAAVIATARKNKVKYILSGNNYATEYGMPACWSWPKQDRKNILAIHSQFGDGVPLKSYPTMGFYEWEVVTRFHLVNFIPILNFIDYKKDEAIQAMREAYNWQYYGGKHNESVFTKFYQDYVLPEKFGIDKRRPHLSALIRNNEVSREKAINELSKPPYEGNSLTNEKEYVLKKLGFSDEEFAEIMNAMLKSHDDYPSDFKLYYQLRSFVRKMLKLK